MNRTRPQPHALVAILALALVVSAPARAEVAVPSIFGDHMVLQRGQPVPVWGRAAPNEQVTVEVSGAGAKASATADAQGNWTARLPALQPADAPVGLTITGSATKEPLVFKDVLIGDVWVCSGQSNMEWSVRASANPDAEIASANHPKLRLFDFPNTVSVGPTKQVKGQWKVCTPESVAGFSAVGYFFGRELLQGGQAPAVGLIANAWGGMPAESFTSAEALAGDPDFAPIIQRKASAESEEAVAKAREAYEKRLREWQDKTFVKDTEPAGEAWAQPELAGDDASGWKPMTLPRMWEDVDPALKIDGAVWFRKEVTVPPGMAGGELTLSLGTIDDFDATYVNGTKVGEHRWGNELGYAAKRKYTVPASLVRDGANVIAVRVFDWFGGGGFAGPAGELFLAPAGPEAIGPIPLAGEWQYRIERSVPQPQRLPNRPAEPLGVKAPNLASNLFNGMVNPIIPYAIKGAIWYQGESNAGRAVQYRKLFPAMIQDWRRHWNQEGDAKDFPFLFVQLANYKERKEEPGESDWAELRDAQLHTLSAVPNAGMAVIIDIGEAKDIHPKNKQDVGKRLALAARKVAHGESDVVYSGPTLKDVKVEGEKIKLTFDNVGTGLEAKDDAPLKGFAIAGADKKWVWASAQIEGTDTVVVSAPGVDKPVAVRYAWADNPDATLYNAEGLPASPFRTDDWPMTTKDNR